jgi:hypothetical protein
MVLAIGLQGVIYKHDIVAAPGNVRGPDCHEDHDDRASAYGEPPGGSMNRVPGARSLGGGIKLSGSLIHPLRRLDWRRAKWQRHGARFDKV